MNIYYIYIYLDPRKLGRYCYKNFSLLYKPIYVGKGKNRRWKEINGNSRTIFFKNKINKIKKSELEPIVFKLYENLNEKESLDKETELINEINIKNPGILVNMTDGGDGISGYKFSEEYLKKRRKNFQDIKKEFERRGYILLSEEKYYKTCDTKLEYRCPEGHEGYITWSNFQQERGCPYCTKHKIDFSEIKKEFERRGYILLSEEKYYKTCDTKLEYICPKGHKGFISWSNFKQGQSCYICNNELKSKNNSGENNSNHKLTEEQIIQIKLLLKEGILTQQEIADMFGVTQILISKIKTGKLWSYVKVN
jgi:predicted XRE-type DNA-binding protein